MAALIPNDQKRGSYSFKRSKVWKLSLSTSQNWKSMGALASNLQKYWSYYLKRLEVWELSHRSATKYSPTRRSRKCSKSSSWADFADVFDDGCFREMQVRQSPEVWELLFLSVQNMGALVLSVRKYGSCRLKSITQSVGALALSAQKYGSSRFIRPQVWALPF